MKEDDDFYCLEDDSLKHLRSLCCDPKKIIFWLLERVHSIERSEHCFKEDPFSLDVLKFLVFLDELLQIIDYFKTEGNWSPLHQIINELRPNPKLAALFEEGPVKLNVSMPEALPLKSPPAGSSLNIYSLQTQENVLISRDILLILQVLNTSPSHHNHYSSRTL